MLGHSVDKFCYFGDNNEMEIASAGFPLSSAGDSRLSQELSRQLARALAVPLRLATRPLHRVAVGTALLKAGDRLTNLPYVVSGRLDAVELDRDLAAYLQDTLRADPRFALHQGDVLKFDFSSLLPARDESARHSLRIVGNLSSRSLPPAPSKLSRSA